jgi:hypothetical protein
VKYISYMAFTETQGMLGREVKAFSKVYGEGQK